MYFLLKCTWNIPRIDQILGHKSRFSKFKKIAIVPSIFSDNKAMRLISITGVKTVKNTNTWRLNNTFLSNKYVTKEIRREIKIS